MRLSDAAWRVGRAVRRYGVRGAVRQALHRARRVPARRRNARRDAAFDRRYGVETAGVVHLATLDVVGGNRNFGVSYEGVDPTRFQTIVGTLPIAYDEYTFVDLGSGKGRALVLAADLPFRRIIGVEFSRELHVIALRNIERLQPGTVRGRRIESVWSDAAEFAFPQEPLVVHFFNPFFGPVMTRVLDNLKASVADAPRDALLCFTGDVPVEVATGEEFVRARAQVYSLARSSEAAAAG